MDALDLAGLLMLIGALFIGFCWGKTGNSGGFVAGCLIFFGGWVIFCLGWLATYVGGTALIIAPAPVFVIAFFATLNKKHNPYRED